MWYHVALGLHFTQSFGMLSCGGLANRHSTVVVNSLSRVARDHKREVSSQDLGSFGDSPQDSKAGQSLRDAHRCHCSDGSMGRFPEVHPPNVIC